MSNKLYYYQTYEHQIANFVKQTGAFMPSMTSGRGAFFQAFRCWQKNEKELNSSNQKNYRGRPVSIFPMPSLGLSFPTPGEEIGAALMVSKGIIAGEEDISRHMNEYGFPHEKMNQPTVSLSGGEQLLLGFARAAALVSVTSSLVACSPTHWLNKSRYAHLEDVISLYEKAGKETEILMLEGEPFPGVCYTHQEHASVKNDLKLPWKFNLNQIEVIFEEQKFPLHLAEHRLRYIVQKNIDPLMSPTLLTGDNGAGKSVLSKVLSGVIKPKKRICSVQCGGSSDRARIVLQDSIDQLFGNSITGYIPWVYQFDSSKEEKASNIYNAIDGMLRDYVQKKQELDLGSVGSRTRPNSILQCKIALVAEKIASDPTLLILDEPGWCLSSSMAKAFVEATCREAQANRVAVLLISHQEEWWSGICNSWLHMTKDMQGNIVIERRE
jgi:energy-coupling factor transporter ATP-binding protein EcfA2